MGDDATSNEPSSRGRDVDASTTVILRAFSNARESASADSALRAALATLNSRDQQDFDHAYKVVMRRNLQWAIDGAPHVKLKGDEFLRLLMESAAGEKPHSSAAEWLRMRQKYGEPGPSSEGRSTASRRRSS
jgi:hypothetical protein